MHCGCPVGLFYLTILLMHLIMSQSELPQYRLMGKSQVISMKILLFVILMVSSSFSIAEEKSKAILIEMGVAEYIGSWFYSSLVSSKDADGITLNYNGSTAKLMYLTKEGCDATESYFEVNEQFLDVECLTDITVLKSTKASEFVYQQAMTGAMNVNYHVGIMVPIRASFDTTDVNKMIAFTDQKYIDFQQKTNNKAQRKKSSF